MAHAEVDHVAAEPIPDVIRLSVQPGTRVLVTSDLHLSDRPTDSSRWVVEELGKVLDSWEGPGVLVFDGDVIELWAGESPDAERALDAQPEFVQRVSTFAAGDDRTVLYIVGNHDGRTGWEQATIGVAMNRLKCRIAFAADIEIAGQKDTVIRIEHGHAYDPANAFDDPRNPHSSPLGQHLVQELMPSFALMRGDLLDGVETLADPRTFPTFISSRLFYRWGAKQALWFLVPVILVLILRIPVAYAWHDGELERLRPFSDALFVADLVIVGELIVGGLIMFFLIRRWWRTASSIVAEQRGTAQNDNTRAAAGQYIKNGYVGLVCGHTHRAELSALDGGFYANTGSGTKMLDRVDAHFGLPSVYLPSMQLAWVILEAGDKPPWRVTLTQGRRPLSGASSLERTVARKRRTLPTDPEPTPHYP